MDTAFAAGRDFLALEGRLVERRLFATLFEAAPPTGVVAALAAYGNADGGFGHGLEPDKRCPASLPVDVECALQALSAAGADAPGLVEAAADYLAAVADAMGSGGAVPLAFPVIEGYPRAEHWTEWTYAPGLNPTAGLVGWLWSLDCRHRFVDEAAAYCWRALDAGELPDDAHALSEVLIFLEHASERARAEAAAEAVAERLASAHLFLADPAATGYGLTPLHLAPSPAARWRRLFSDAAVAGHLDRLAADQQADGGWPITWTPPSEASLLEWRGIETLRALRVLVAYGRLEP